MGHLYVELNINGRTTVYSIEVMSGELVLIDPHGTRYSLGYALRDDIAYTEAVACFLKNPTEIIPMLKKDVKVIGGL